MFCICLRVVWSGGSSSGVRIRLAELIFGESRCSINQPLTPALSRGEREPVLVGAGAVGMALVNSALTAALAWCKVGVAPLVHSFRIRCANSASAPSFSPPCEGGARGGGPVSFECTREPCLARPIDEVDGACAASPAFKACRFRTSLRANGEYTDDAEVLRPTPGEAEAVWPTPPSPPFTRGGKEGRMCATKTLLWRSTFQPSQPQLCTALTPALSRGEREPVIVGAGAVGLALVNLALTPALSRGEREPVLADAAALWNAVVSCIIASKLARRLNRRTTGHALFHRASWTVAPTPAPTTPA